MGSWILHVDLDQFIAAVELLRRPELAGRPVVVGGAGDPTLRSVVATASYEAREYGIRSGMPMRTAAKRCPDAVFLPSDPAAYDDASAEVMATLREFDVVVEVLGWDEAFVGAETDDPEDLAGRIQDAVWNRTHLSCSVGVGDTKLRAKLATGFAKPAGIYRLTRDNWFEVMAERPTTALWGIGTRTARKLADLGYTTVAELARADPDDLLVLGPRMGPWYRTLALGAGSTEVSATPWVPRSHSRETTFQHDLTDPDDLRRELAALAERVAGDVAAEGRPAVRVGVKARFAPFLTRTRSLTLPGPTSDGAAIAAAALTAFERFDLVRPVRLLGVWAEFEPPPGGY
ncbi:MULTISPECIES: DNA polymerase IV [Actinokineospora]|uniref:DNA polymerase IV n=1 Tax=Actinokineospora fastidiosa TaxID=1816 RepID=A0A918GRF5_9PSEU|nr:MULTISPECIES: DNA polymerase IV [Actinokineospora]UVS81313.1 DNA polymerase IV [Actinokineospora sp. UTMC 2448]GGS52845.1 DNA polymerase IV [Actinokineospora fastidiosa]